ncbi:hypothetical protein ONE63_008145 [Megalurothrips usitatus]|uniref:Uncharacterized protein n=1 Tax=Megalurothrips usitatus TaxID=439358 RepID=A0AAV7XPD5_9NEOP|nr:hypothetical protein ONE63_008145 [Megalurothrips usitatus]
MSVGVDVDHNSDDYSEQLGQWERLWLLPEVRRELRKEGPTDGKFVQPAFGLGGPRVISAVLLWRRDRLQVPRSPPSPTPDTSAHINTRELRQTAFV